MAKIGSFGKYYYKLKQTVGLIKTILTPLKTTFFNEKFHCNKTAAYLTSYCLGRVVDCNDKNTFIFKFMNQSN